MLNPKSRQLRARPSDIVLSKQSVGKGICFRGLYISPLERLKHVGQGGKWKHRHGLIKKLKQGGGYQMKSCSIALAAKKTKGNIETVFKLDNYLF